MNCVCIDEIRNKNKNKKVEMSNKVVCSLGNHVGNWPKIHRCDILR